MKMFQFTLLLLVLCLLFISIHANNSKKKIGETIASPTTTTTTTTPEPPVPIPITVWTTAKQTSTDIKPEIGDAVNIFRSYSDFVQITRAQNNLSITLSKDIASMTNPILEQQIESICSGLESISPEKDSKTYTEILVAAQALVKNNRDSVLSISLLSVVLVGGGDAINGDRSNSMKSHALRRANNLGKLRIKEIEQQLATIQLKEPLLHPFAFEYYTRERRIIGRTSNLLGRLLFDEGEWDDAIETLESALSSDSAIPEAYEWLGRFRKSVP